MKLKMKGRFLSILVALAMVVTMMPMMGQTAYAAPEFPDAIKLVYKGGGGDVLIKDDNQVNFIYFGHYPQSSDGVGGFKNEPILWRVLDVHEGSDNTREQLFLLSERILDWQNYHHSWDNVTWSHSAIRGWLNGEGNASFKNKAFSTEERNAIFKTRLENENNPRWDIDGGIATEDEIFLLSYSDATNEDYDFTKITFDEYGYPSNLTCANRAARGTDYSKAAGAGNSWWLRTPGAYQDQYTYVNEDGKLDLDGTAVSTACGIRPAFNLNPQKALFLSTAAGGKSLEVGRNSLSAPGENNTNEWKLTLRDEAHAGFKVDAVTSCDGKNLTIKYSKAVKDDNEYISAIIEDKNNRIKYYGKIAAASDADGATAVVNIDGLMGDEDKLYIFNEQCNGGCETDFSSELQEVTDVIATDHTWDGGKVTKAATTTATGVRTFTCTTCDATRTETIPKLTDPVGPGASGEAAEKVITKTTSDKDIKGSQFAPLKLKSTKQGKKNIKLTWTKNKKAVKYVVYGNRCNGKGKKYKPVKLATVKGASYNVKKIKKSKLKKGKYYKFVVVALDKNNRVVSTSKMIHVATKGGKVGNHKGVTVKAKVNKKGKKIKSYKALGSTVLKKGKKLKLKVTASLASKKRKVKQHVGLRYESSNPKVATVSGGKITAKGKGSCYIYVYAQNGVSKRIKVTVK